MKLFSQLLVLGLAADLTVASTWFSKAGKSSQTSCSPSLYNLIHLHFFDNVLIIHFTGMSHYELFVSIAFVMSIPCRVDIFVHSNMLTTFPFQSITSGMKRNLKDGCRITIFPIQLLLTARTLRIL